MKIPPVGIAVDNPYFIFNWTIINTIKGSISVLPLTESVASRLSSRRVVFMCFSTIGGRFSMLVTSMPFNKRRVFANAICGVKCRNRRAKINERTFFIQFNIPPCNTNSPNCASLHFVLESLPQQENLKLECCNRIPLQPFPMRQTFSL